MRVPVLHSTVKAALRTTPQVARAYVSDVLLCAALGVALCVGGWHRVSSGAFATLRESGGPYLWGGVLIGVAAVMAVALFTDVRVVANVQRSAALPLLIFAFFFGHAAIIDPVASTIGVVLCGYVVFHFVSRADTWIESARQVAR